ncbi:MAG TPA: DUF1289 domain-containing protein [Bauldia sp.]|nr:DUF1289 domain-containing protein [Bauldia sp.]
MIATPCIKVCVIDPMSRLCTGCGRTLAEIGAWRDYSAAERQAIMERLAERRAAGEPVRSAGRGR